MKQSIKIDLQEVGRTELCYFIAYSLRTFGKMPKTIESLCTVFTRPIFGGKLQIFCRSAKNLHFPAKFVDLWESPQFRAHNPLKIQSSSHKISFMFGSKYMNRDVLTCAHSSHINPVHNHHSLPIWIQKTNCWASR